MTSNISQLVEERFEILTQLLQLTDRQENAIAAGHMNELMSVLSQKQRQIEVLMQHNQKLKVATGEQTPTNDGSLATREQFKQCDALHQELLKREGACEQELIGRREELAVQLIRQEGTRRAVSRYDQASTPADSTMRGSLDLSSDD